MFTSVAAGLWCTYVVHELRATCPVDWLLLKREDSHGGVLALIKPGDFYSDMRKTKGYDIISRRVRAVGVDGDWRILVYYSDEESKISHAYIEYGGGFEGLMTRRKIIIEKESNQ